MAMLNNKRVYLVLNPHKTNESDTSHWAQFLSQLNPPGQNSHFSTTRQQIQLLNQKIEALESKVKSSGRLGKSGASPPSDVTLWLCQNSY